MTAYEIIQTMFAFGGYTIAVISLVFAIINDKNKK